MACIAQLSTRSLSRRTSGTSSGPLIDRPFQPLRCGGMDSEILEHAASVGGWVSPGLRGCDEVAGSLSSRRGSSGGPCCRRFAATSARRGEQTTAGRPPAWLRPAHELGPLVSTEVVDKDVADRSHRECQVAQAHDRPDLNRLASAPREGTEHSQQTGANSPLSSPYRGLADR